ncbi:LAGLIDADG family homing endonuclease [Baekduia sp. Peel2402]|uniref:LAGLIDADG family homing endonuclease n=1 Tax=Baekduia sp. Peel2402 TaxID=3458296 RepID=UPI00403EAD09
MRWDNLKIDASEGTRLPGYKDPAVVRTFDAPEALQTRFYEIHAKSALNRVPEASRMPFRWTINPYRGCSHACVYCMGPLTKVLMADGSEREIRHLHPGDEIVGTRTSGAYRRFVTTEVRDVWSTVKPAFRVTLADGTELIASGDHRFLSDRGWKFVQGAMSGPSQRPYLTTGNSLMGFGALPEGPLKDEDYRRGYLCGMVRGDGSFSVAITQRRREPVYSISDRFRLALADDEALLRSRAYLAGEDVHTHLSAFANPGRPMRQIRTGRRDGVWSIKDLIRWPDDPHLDWCKGFLAGIFDAEGSWSGGILRIANMDPEILQMIERCLRRLGFDCVVEPARPNGCRNVRIRGGLVQHLRFFALVDPAITRKRSLNGKALKTDAKLDVVSIEPLEGAQRLMDITTGTGDFIANGVISHNCFARPTHTYLDFDAGKDFEREIVVKVNVPEVLRAELKRPSWKGEHIAMGTNTDPYQWVEGRYKLMTGIWEALRDFRNPCSVLTKSPLVLRDLPLLKEIAAVTDISASLSIPTIDEKAWRATEPHTPNPRARLEAVAELNRNGIPTGILVAPLMPGINDDPKQVEEIIQTAIDAGATSIGGIGLHLRGEVRGVFMEWLRAYRPDLVEHYEELYARGAYLQPPERDRIARLLVRAGAPAARPFRRDPADERPFDRAFRRQMGSRARPATTARRHPEPPSAVQEALF